MLAAKLLKSSTYKAIRLGVFAELVFLLVLIAHSNHALSKTGNSDQLITSGQVEAANTIAPTPSLQPSPSSQTKKVKNTNSPSPVTQQKNNEPTPTPNNQKKDDTQTDNNTSPSPTPSPVATPTHVPDPTPLSAELTIERFTENGTNYLKGTVTANKILSGCDWQIGMLGQNQDVNSASCTFQAGQSPNQPRSAKVTIHTPEGDELTLEKQ